MSEEIVQLNEKVIKGQLKELVRGGVEETLNVIPETGWTYFISDVSEKTRTANLLYSFSEAGFLQENSRHTVVLSTRLQKGRIGLFSKYEARKEWPNDFHTD